MNQTTVNQNRSLIKKYNIPLDHIDFEYVNKCEDPKELKHIIKILESGEEGLYPSLLVKTEERLRQIKPDASILNRKLCFAPKSSDLSANEDYDDVFNDIAKWIHNSKEQENKLEARRKNDKTLTKSDKIYEKAFNELRDAITKTPISQNKWTVNSKGHSKENDLESANQNSTSHINGHDEHPVRKPIDLTSMFNSEKPERDLPMSKMPSVHHEPLQASYSKWDKYDPDVELMKLDNKEKVEKLQMYRKRNINSNCLSVGSNDTNLQDRVKSMKSFVDTMPKNGTLKPQDLAMREKELGNECFKSNDYVEALRHYNTSIGIHSSPEARNNRAMSLIKLEKYELALDDLRVVIESDPKNVKAHFRRGSCFKAISMYCLALRSFETTIKYDCNNHLALNHIKELKNLISTMPSKSLIRVREITRHYDQSVWDIEDPFHVSYVELSELNKESVEYLYEADSFGCLTECVCNLCPWHEWQQRKKKWGRHKMLKTEGPRKRWQLLTSDILPAMMSKSLAPELSRPKRLSITEINSTKTSGHHHTDTTEIHHNGVHRNDKSPLDHCENGELSIKPVSNVQEFLLYWKTASKKNNYELYHKLLRSIKPMDLPKVISTNLDEEIMSKFLETLNQKFDPDNELDLIIEYLTAMTKVNRFNLIVKMLDNKVKEGFQPLLKRVHHHTKNNLFSALL